MNDRMMQFRVGVTVLATAIIAAILTVLFGDLPSLVQGTYPLRMSFLDARGVSAGTPLRKNGILVGRVQKVTLDESGGVTVVADVDSHVPIYRDEQPQIVGSLLGDAEIQLVPGRVIPPRTRIAPDDVLRGAMTSDPLEAFSKLEPKLLTALDALVAASETVGKLAGDIDRVVVGNDDRFSKLIDKTEVALDGFSTAMTNVNDVLGDQTARTRLKQSIELMPEVLGNLQSAVGGIGTALDSADRNLRNLEGLTKPLGDRGADLVMRLDTTIGRLDQVLAQAAGFTRALNESDGTLGRLVRDPKVYENLSEAAERVNRIAGDLRPIINDVRVFTDKIARHPESLGVRGALDRRPGLK
jgi:phospholipid/cholesterol/gamma-HCH transport system substrate-binding protein